ncbi:MAG TPA: carbamoyltransferase C-terminal domain-containing protein [Phnomibacter sp.]|nr:carbamoyltransferase C-terminal domain-containing protein [Phnomibacter sp.]
MGLTGKPVGLDNNMPLHYLHINPYYLPDVSFGGPVFSVSALCEALVANGDKVTVYTVGYDKQQQYPLRTNVNGVEVIYFKGNAGKPCQVSFQLWNALAKNCRNFDVVHLHTWWNILIFHSIRILNKAGVLHIVSPRGMMSDYSFTHRKTRIKQLFHQTMMLPLLSKTVLHGTARAEAAEMAKRCNRSEEGIFVMPNLLNLKPIAKHVPVRGKYSLGFLSRLHHKKGIEELLQAVALCPEVHELVIGGRGSEAYETFLQQQIAALQIEHKVRFVGWVSDEEKPTFFRQFQVFVLPSFNENFANVVAEAWAAGKPTIVSTEVGISHFVEQHSLGWICRAEKNSIAESISQAWQDRELWPFMGEAALQLSRAQFTNQSIIAQYQQMYQEVISRKGSRGTSRSVRTATPNDMYILGINAHHADASAALLKNGRLIAAIEEERLRRIKHWAGFPSMAVEFCLKEAGIDMSQVHTVAVSKDPRAKWWKKASFMLTHPKAMSFAVKGRLTNAEAISSIEDSIQLLAGGSSNGNRTYKVVNVEHHRSHLASAFYASGMEEAALLSIDGSGDFTTTMMARGKGMDIEVLDSIDFPHSMGIFYTAFTQLLGFPHYGDEYKVMGLAPYGQPVYFEQMKQVVQWHSNGTFSLSDECFRRPEKGYIYYDQQHRPIVPILYSDHLEKLFGGARPSQEPLTQFHYDLAASVQKMLEETLFHLLRHLHKTTGLKKLCLAGGVAQNSVANGKITRNTPFEEVYVPSAGHDAGLSMGAAMYVAHSQLRIPRNEGIHHAYLGSGYSNEEIKKYLADTKFQHRLLLDNQELYEEVAKCIAAGGVIGWFKGKSEFGPRALGNRSILADPRRADAKDLLNKKIKRRESFRPFAPSVLAEYADEYFEFCEPAPFMEKVFPVRAGKQNLIPAVTHVDGSGRLQTVCRQNNHTYYDLIDTFRKHTGIPILLNTSFNENEPIVNTPAEALDCFARTNMDMLVLENFIITR